MTRIFENLLSHLLEQKVYVESGQSRSGKETEIALLRKLLPLRNVNLELVLQVDLVPDDEQRHVLVDGFTERLHPLREIFEAAPIRHVVDENAGARVPVVDWAERPVLLVTGGVPYLESYRFVVDLLRERVERRADGLVVVSRPLVLDEAPNEGCFPNERIAKKNNAVLL